MLRDVFVRGKYRDVILPMCVLRRLDAVLEPTAQVVQDVKTMLEENGITEQEEVLCSAAGQAFYNTRSSDGQLLFLANMESKMDHKSMLGSRIAEVHNGASLFAGDAGLDESNIRRWPIENDWREAIVALPLNLFYNTGIATSMYSL